MTGGLFMLASLAFIFLTGLLLSALSEKMRLPGIVGMIAAGVLLGGSGLNLLDASIQDISAPLRQMALVIILIRAGLSLSVSELKKVGRPAALMSFVPAGFELTGYVLFAPLLLGVTRVEAALMGAVLAAVSPAIVVPRMLRLMQEKRGTARGIPQLLMAGASCDDIFVIVLFSVFSGMAQGEGVHAADLLRAPVAILLGTLLGALTGAGVARLFSLSGRCIRPVRSAAQPLILLSAAFLMTAAETRLQETVPLSGLLAVTVMACAVRTVGSGETSTRLAGQFEKLWSGAEVLLFVLVGAATDVRYTLAAGLPALAVILLALLCRSAGVLCCLIGTGLTRKERLFCVLSYLPKATVQAAMGAVPLAMGLPCGEMILSVAVLAILFTAPVGAALMGAGSKRLLSQDG